MYWANFLHFYQPPTQKRYWVDRVTSESYRRLITGFLKHPRAKVTLNINAILLEFWDEYGHQDVLEGLYKLLSRGQIELTGSAKYHPLLPKLPASEITRQIYLNESTSRKYFGDLYNPRGFFPPEMAYDRKVAKVVADLGYEWIIAEELSLNHRFGAVDYSKVYEVGGIEVQNSIRQLADKPPLLKVFFRERNLSYQILSGQLGTPELFLKALGGRASGGKYLLTAMDGETFGHHRPGMDKLLLDLFEIPDLKTILVSELLTLFEDRVAVETLPSTWALMSHNLEKNVPFARWEDPDNEIHKLQWELTDLAITAVNNSKYAVPLQGLKEKSQALRPVPEPGSGEFGPVSPARRQWLKARYLLDRALHSDQYWWASARPWWSLEMIERGAIEFLGAIRTVPDIPKKVEDRAQSLYYAIITAGFDWQREGKVEEMARAEDETVRMRADYGVSDLPAQEIDKMIAVIRGEMLSVAERQEYERAVQLRDRIRELEGYKANAS